MANEFIARKGLISLSDVQVTGSLDVSENLIINDITASGNISSSGYIYGTPLVGPNEYAFRYTNGASIFNTGLFFNATTGQYEFLNGSADCIFCIKAGTGHTTIEGNVTASLNISASGALTTGYLTASGLYYPDTDGVDGQALITDGNGKLTFDDIKVYVQVKNISGGNLVKGTPVHATASASPPAGNVSEVVPASASVASTMPATFILDEDITNGSEGRAILSGFINGVNTSTFNEGDVVYVGENGGYTNVKPTGNTNLIQNLGIVTKVDASNGSGYIYGSGRSNDVPNLPTGKIWVGSDTYSVTSSVISLDETNKFISGSETAKFKLGTYAFGYNTIPGFGFDITGSGIIISSSLPSEHYPMLKIGETELIGLNNEPLLAQSTFLINNVDTFLITSGSEPTEVSSNKLLEHNGDIFKIYTKGNTAPNLSVSSGSIDISAPIIYLQGANDLYVKTTNSTSTPQYVATWQSEPNAGAGAILNYTTASVFGGGGSSTPYSLGTFGGRYNWSSTEDNVRIAHGYVNGPTAGASANDDNFGPYLDTHTINTTTETFNTYKVQYYGIYSPVAGVPHIKAWGRSSDADFSTNGCKMGISVWSFTEPANGTASTTTATLRASSPTITIPGSTIYYLGNGMEASGSQSLPAGTMYIVTMDLSGSIDATANLYMNFHLWIE